MATTVADLLVEIGADVSDVETAMAGLGDVLTDDVLETAGTVADGFEDMSETIGGVVGETLETVGDMASDVLGVVEAFGQGIASGVVAVVTTVVDWVVGLFRRVDEEAQEARETLAAFFDDTLLVDVDFAGGELLEYVAEVGEVFRQRFMRIGAALSEGIGDALADAAGRYLGEGASIFQNLHDGIREAVESAIIEAVVTKGVFEGILGPALSELTLALTEGRMADARSIIEDIAAQIPGIAELLEGILAPLKDTLDGAFGPESMLLPDVRSGGGGMDASAMSMGGLSTQAATHHGRFLRSPVGMTQTIILELDSRVLAQAVVEEMPELLRLQGVG